MCDDQRSVNERIFQRVQASLFLNARQGLGAVYLFEFYVDRAEIQLHLRPHGKMTAVVGNPDREFSIRPDHAILAENSRLDADRVNAPQHRVDSLTFRNCYRQTKQAARIDDRNLERLSDFEILRAEKVNHRQYVLDGCCEIQRGYSRRLILIWIAFGPGDYAVLVIKDRFADSYPLTLFIELLGLKSAKHLRVDGGFDMLMKAKTGQPGKETFADYIGRQLQRIRRAFGFSCHGLSAEAELASINASQQRSLELGLINQLFTLRKRQRCRDRLLGTWLDPCCKEQARERQD